MATVNGLGTTFNLPNFTGELFNVAPSETPFLSAIGGLGQGKRTDSVEFQWQIEGLEETAVNNAKVEGATAPTASEVSRSAVSNVVEIHQESVEVSYTKQAATGQLSGINIAGADNPVTDELSHQIMLKLSKVGVDIEKSFLLGQYAKPADLSAPRKTRGVLSAVTTNLFTDTDNRALTEDIVSSALQAMYDNGAKLPQDTTVFMVSGAQKRMLTKVYGQAPTLNQPTQSRTVGGVAVDTIVTDFGTFGVMLNRWMPTDSIGIIDLSVCVPVFLEIPGKGVLFAEPLAKTGSSEKYQLYGEVGLEYGPEVYHGLINKLMTPAEVAAAE
ncbi:major head protein [Mycobacterium phage Mendokysei]|uniref:Major capsid protein n=1 Tax=Mycobacterium phage Mendokysei TaxID=2099637 RepID=A0A2P1CGV3_9CAUD|nr:major head protein [Mycobacterium phage Mendokysei]AVJ50225.1 major capsid protein [Mycobacterium phage Mendokysei]